MVADDLESHLDLPKVKYGKTTIDPNNVSDEVFISAIGEITYLYYGFSREVSRTGEKDGHDNKRKLYERISTFLKQEKYRPFWPQAVELLRKAGLEDRYLKDHILNILSARGAI